jgi:hypothetical protein
MKTELLLKQRFIMAENTFAEIVIWPLAEPPTGSAHAYKYRLAYMVDGVCILSYNNETGKGDHQHIGNHELKYHFISTEQLIDDFFSQIKLGEGE